LHAAKHKDNKLHKHTISASPLLPLLIEYDSMAMLRVARCAGFHPAKTLPCVIDVGTNNAALRADPLYCGLDQPRITGPAYYELVDEVNS
jgi:hypothetical protein